MPKEAATQGNTCFYFREEKDDNKVILEDKDLEVIGTPSVQYDDCTVIAQVRKWQLALSTGVPPLSTSRRDIGIASAAWSTGQQKVLCRATYETSDELSMWRPPAAACSYKYVLTILLLYCTYYFSKTGGTLNMLRAILESRIGLLLRPIPQQISANHMRVVSVKIRAQRTSGPSKCVRVRGSSSGRSEILTFTNGIWQEDDGFEDNEDIQGSAKRVLRKFCEWYSLFLLLSNLR